MQLLGALPQTSLHTVYTVTKMHIVWSYILNLIVLIFLLNQSGSPPVWCFISWKAPEDRCYSATKGKIFMLKFTKYRLVAGLRPDPLGEGRGKNTNFCSPNRKIVPAPMHAGRYSIYQPRRDGRLSWPWCWLYTETVYLSASSHPSKARSPSVECRVAGTIRAAVDAERSLCLGHMIWYYEWFALENWQL